jgi:hypothetical protein
LFDFLPNTVAETIHQHRVIASDLARLHALRDALDQGYKNVAWLDADFLVFDPIRFVLPEQPYAVGREVWVQYDKNGKLKVYKKVHNAFLMFRQGNSFLEFYTETAERLLWLHQATMPPQYIGPKLLTALHNIAILPVLETAGMLSPMVVSDIVNGGGAALDRFVEQSPESITAANLCISSCNRDEVSGEYMETLIDILLDKKSV